MASGSCIYVPLINGKPSKLYNDLNKALKDRPLTNLIYASYLQPGVADRLDSMGKTNRDRLNQHSAKDVIDFFDAITMQTQAINETARLAHRIGATDVYGNLIDFDDASQALGIANHLNANNKGIVAYVTQHSDKFNINVVPKDARTQLVVATEMEKQKVWDVLKQSFAPLGIDLDNSIMSKDMVNANRGVTFVSWMHNIQKARNNILGYKDIHTLLAINENSQQVQRLKQMFGTLDDVAQKAYDAYRVRGSVTAGQFALIDATLDNSKQFNGLNLTAIEQQVNDITQDTQATKEYAIDSTLKQLNRDFHISREEHDREGEKIKSLSDAADEAAITLQRQYKQTRALLGEFHADTKAINRTLNTLMKEIASKRYYSGILGFMQEANKQVQNIVTSIQTAPTSPRQWDRLIEMSKKIMQFKDIYAGYNHILKSLINIDNLIIDEIISDQDKQAIKQLATTLSDLLDREATNIVGDNQKDGIAQSNMIDICTEILGPRLSNGMATANYVITAQMDSNFGDRWLYSVGRMSNPVVAALGTVIQDARLDYDEKVQEYSTLIRRAHYKLRKAGFKNTEFIYDEDGRIISDIDWAAYEAAYSAAKSHALQQGYRGLNLDEYMLNWVEQNTEDKVVDDRPGINRTERIPNANYRKAFPQLAPAQLEYYKTMMKLKGELGTLLPAYAQRHYIPPQIRRSFLDAMGAAIRGKDGNVFKAMVKAIITRIKDMYTIREDDTDFASNGIIVGGEDFALASGALDNTPLKQIPIFYVNRLKDQSQLIKDFSGAMQHFMQTALHFDAMNRVRDIIEFMGDYITRGKGAALGFDNKKLAEEVANEDVSIIKRLWKFGKNTNTNAIVEGMIDYHLYGVKIKNPNKYTKLLKSLLAYNSMRSLTVNLKGMISNYVVGVLQTIIEAGGNEYYNFADLAWAFAKVAGDNTIGAPGRIVDFIMNNVNSKSVLLGKLFDPLIDASDEEGHKRYYNNPLRKLLSVDLSFMGYGAGEHMIHYLNMYAILKHIKVKVNGRETSLYNIFKVHNKVDGNSELTWDKTATYIDENNVERPVDRKYINKIKDIMKEVNQNTHGSMNDLDKGLLHQYMAGKFIANLRQWMVEHYSRRYRGSHWSANVKHNVEGFHYTTWRYLVGLADDMFKLEHDAALHWKDMNKHQRANVRKALTEAAVLGLLQGLSIGLGAPEDHKKEFWYRMWIYQTKRAIVDVYGSTPIGIPAELNTLINSPISATNTVNAMLYPFTGLGDIGTKLQRGKHQGEDKYWRNVQKYWFPFVKHIEQYYEMGEDEGVFQVFNKNNLQ